MVFKKISIGGVLYGDSYDCGGESSGLFDFNGVTNVDFRD